MKKAKFIFVILSCFMLLLSPACDSNLVGPEDGDNNGPPPGDQQD